MSLKALKALRIPYTTESYGPQKGRVHTIRLPFTPKQFMDVCSRGGDLLPMCCGTISEMRDIITETLREGGWIQMDKLTALVSLMRHHEGYQEMFDPKQRATMNQKDPFVRIALAWEALVDCMQTDYPHNSPKAEVPTDVRDAAVLLSNACALYWMQDIGRRGEAYPEENYPRMSAEERAQKNAEARFDHAKSKIEATLRILPPLRTMWEKVVAEAPGPIEGWCAVLKVRPMWQDVPTEDGRTKREMVPNISTDSFGHGIVLTATGLGIYQTPEKLDETIEIWKARYPNIRDIIEVRMVRVSAADGITFLG